MDRCTGYDMVARQGHWCLAQKFRNGEDLPFDNGTPLEWVVFWGPSDLFLKNDLLRAYSYRKTFLSTPTEMQSHGE